MFKVIRFTASNLMKMKSIAPPVRFLYNAETLGLIPYVGVREKITMKLDNDAKHKFFARMAEFVANSKELVFTEDLKQVIHLTSDTDEDIALVKNMILKFCGQSEEMRFGNYIFGPVVMRMYHHLKRPIDALETFKHPQLEMFFDQLSSYIILMDLLFENGMYEEVLDVYKTMRGRQMAFGKHPKSAMVIVFASCYKLNNPEVMQYVLELWKEMKESGHEPLRKSVCFMAALFMNQNAPHFAMEILSTMQNQNYILIRSLKVLTLCALNRTEDAMPLLKSVVKMDYPNAPKHTFPVDVLDKVKEYVAASNNKLLFDDFERLEKHLKAEGYVTDATLDSILSTSVVVITPVNKKKEFFGVPFHAPKLTPFTEKANRSRYRFKGLQEV